jgi:hypothetical protein
MSISYTLDRIERQASWTKHHANQALQYARHLPAKRSFETLAEDALAKAEQELTEALANIREARKVYEAKLVNDKAA